MGPRYQEAGARRELVSPGYHSGGPGPALVSPGYQPGARRPEAASPGYQAGEPQRQAGSAGYQPAAPRPEPAEPPPRAEAEPRPTAAARAEAKLEQIKDLYVTAEAIGEDALVKHFEEVSRRQRELIREYFEQSGFKAGGTPGGTGPAADGAQLSG